MTTAPRPSTGFPGRRGFNQGGWKMTRSKDDIEIETFVAELKAEQAKKGAAASELLAGFDKQFAPIAEYIEKPNTAIRTVDETASITVTAWKLEKDRKAQRTCRFQRTDRKIDEHLITAQGEKISFAGRPYLADQFHFLKKQILETVKKYCWP
jgi:hypothetical protein